MNATNKIQLLTRLSAKIKPKETPEIANVVTCIVIQPSEMPAVMTEQIRERSHDDSAIIVVLCSSQTGHSMCEI